MAYNFRTSAMEGNMPKKSIRIIILSFCLIIVFSCKKEKIEEEKNELVARNLTPTEINIAKNICESLKKKRLFFDRLSQGDNAGQFGFKVYFKDCNESSIKNMGRVTANFNPESYSFETRSRYSRFFSQIIHDDRGPMKDLCHEILDRNNTRDLKNIVDTGDKKLKYGFYKNDNYIFEIDTYFLENGKWQKFFIEYFEVKKSTGRREGMVSTRIRKAFCADGKSQLTKQILK